jgi:hypothetical protein
VARVFVPKTVTQDSSVTNDQQRIPTLMSVIQKAFYFEKNQNQLIFEKQLFSNSVI